ncbi:anthranilate phosphoribosyltransferase [Fulvimarina sp. 2208YS6-2-32]|uniref:Anthranilate phosphoribosyltransferase n=1 Tax=Fulvimarina uroteuthidis TaxID=3098149 RepID=A0ABU5HZV2_9HYPH|nr:anthranilate phosphoribosyltransferase [Fulvimarina sp. 2208YS6-2-32]MDY8108661.1 anthranilate phosphoribosyltransferase [Fulvimarina sp. 2208YS6-2-32]
MSERLKPYLAKVASGLSLTRTEAEDAFSIIMSGEATAAQIGGLLMALRVRGESVDEITGAVTAMRANMTRVKAPEGTVDIVGTGGDNSGTVNISTASAFVLAGCGVPVAKHGNRALSSRSGAADVLAALGVDIELKPEQLSTVIEQAGLVFLFAPNHHAAMRHVGPARKDLGTRTMFNILGPMTNPAGVTRLLIGVFAPEWIEPMALTLRELGTEAAWVVHGEGLDEMTITGETQVAELKNDDIRMFTVTPEEVGLKRADLADIRGGVAADNALRLSALLAGEAGAYRDIVCLNTGGALVVAGRAQDLKEGIAMAQGSIDRGNARAALDRLVTVTQRLGKNAA